MGKYLMAVDLEKTRIGSPELDQLYEEGWDLWGRLLPPEYTKGGDVLRNWFILCKKRTSGGNGECDLTEVWDTIGNLGLSIDAMDQLITDVQLRVAALEQLPPGGGADFSTRKIPIEIWSYRDLTDELRIQPEHAINRDPKFTYGIMSGNMFHARLTIGAGGDVNYGNYLFRPIMAVSGYQAQNPLGQAAYEGAKNGFTLQGQSMWKKYDRPLYIDGQEVGGNKFFIRMSSPTWDYLENELGLDFEMLHGEKGYRPLGMAGGDRYWGKASQGKSFPWNSFGGDVIWVTIPVFAL